MPEWSDSDVPVRGPLSNADIADELETPERGIERRLEKIRSKWMSFDDGTP